MRNIMLCGSVFWGILIGSFIGGLPGAIIGGVIGWFIDNQSINSPRKNAYKKNIVVEALVDMMLIVSISDGRIDQKQKIMIMDFFQNNSFSQEVIDQIRKDINDFNPNTANMHEITSIVNNYLKYNEKLILLDTLFKIALSDNVITDDELKKIRQLANLMRIKRYDFESIESIHINAKGAHGTYTGKRDFNPYEILGVSEDATTEEIKKAYRDLIKKYHPDKASHMGEEFKKIAEEKVRKINQAYTILTGR